MDRWFKILLIVLLIANMAEIYFFGEEVDRWARFGTMLVFFLVYLFSRGFSNVIYILIFGLFLLCDYFLIYYENVTFKSLTYFTRIVAYILIIVAIWPNLRKLKVNLFTGIITAFVVALNIYLINTMSESVPEVMRSDYFFPLFYIFGIILLALAAAAISYHNRFGNTKSFYLVLASFGLILSDIFYYIAYYLEFETFWYLDRAANIIGIAMLMAFVYKKAPISA